MKKIIKAETTTSSNERKDLLRAAYYKKKQDKKKKRGCIMTPETENMKRAREIVARIGYSPTVGMVTHERLAEQIAEVLNETQNVVTLPREKSYDAPTETKTMMHWGWNDCLKAIRNLEANKGVVFRESTE